MSPPRLVNAARRTFIRSLGLAAGAAAFLQARNARAAEPPHVDVKDPAAVALGYVENATQVDVKKFPTYVKGSTCEDCLLLQGKEGNAYRPCNLFPGKLVAVKGWCTGWTAEI
jgi:High potential iron-sulfur protein